MAEEVTWEEPPPSGRGTRGTKYQAQIDALKANPGQWAKVIERRTAASARPFKAQGCEVTTRANYPENKNLVDIFARFPEEGTPPTPKAKAEDKPEAPKRPARKRPSRAKKS